MIVVTGGAGFIGSALLWKLNSEGIENIIIIDRLGTSEKWKNIVKRRFVDYIHKDDFIRMIYNDQVPFTVRAIVHLGACSSTTERDADYLWRNNYLYSCRICEWAVQNGIPFIYASSAATYGDGTFGFSDDDNITIQLKPVNMYGYSKQLFDLWILKRSLQNFVVGLKFFNVFGPNEYHKGEMRSMVHKAFEQITKEGKVRLFKSYRVGYGNGEQKRDFIYVKDCVEVIWWFLQNREIKGIFNVGTGKARTWNDLAKAVFSSMGLPVNIEYIDMPPALEKQYQYFTEANMSKLINAGFHINFHSLEDAINDYVKGYLMGNDPYL